MKNIATVGECMIEGNGKSFGAIHQKIFGGDKLNAAVANSIPKSKKLRYHSFLQN